MRQISVLHPGGFRVLRMIRAAQPTPGPGMVVIDVEAAGVNFADCVARLGLYAASWRFAGWPFTPGFEVAGRVSALGTGVHDLDIGKRVIALTHFGGYAEQVAVPRHQVFDCPSRLTTPQAAGIAVVFLTAAYALDELAAPRPASTVLVHSAAGGVGGALLQLARLRASAQWASSGPPISFKRQWMRARMRSSMRQARIGSRQLAITRRMGIKPSSTLTA
jgi:NADPH:quinone reductase-like Zn-dependent oxidoreductase